MKAYINYITFTILISTLGVISCKKTESPDTENEITFDSIKTSNIYHLDGDSTKPSCSLKINYVFPVKYKDQAVLNKIQKELNYTVFEDETLGLLLAEDAVKRYTESYVKNYKEEAESNFPDWEKSDETLDYFSFYKTIETSVLFNKADLISYQITSMDYKGGANSYTAYKNLVIDLKTGNILTEDDIFNPEYGRVLNQVIIDKIVKQNNAKKTEELLELGYWGIEDLTSNGNFWVDDKGITYIFSQGEYSAPSLGEITVKIPYSEIHEILKDNSPISLFFE